jgi:foldase protein PrsA
MIKNKSSYIISTVVALALAGTMLLTGCSKPEYVAKIGNDSITKQEYAYFLSYEKQRIIVQAEQSGNLAKGADEEALKKFWQTSMGETDNFGAAKEKALDYAQEFKIQLIKAKEKKITVDKSEIESMNKGLDDWIATNKITPEKFKEMHGLNVDEFKKVYESVALVSKYAKGEQENIEVTEDDIKKAYEENKENIDTVTVVHVLKKTVDQNEKPLPNDKIEEAKKKADEILKKVKAGEDIKALAKQYSEDGGVATNEGQYEFKRDGNYVEEFKAWAFDSKVGESGIVKTNFGYHVMKLMKRTGYEEGKDGAISYAKSQKYKEIMDAQKKEPAYEMKENKAVYDSFTL